MKTCISESTIEFGLTTYQKDNKTRYFTVLRQMLAKDTNIYGKLFDNTGQTIFKILLRPEVKVAVT